MRILIFGTGDYYERYKKWFEREEILALLDNSLEKQGTWMDEIQVLSPEEGVRLPYDKIIVLSFYIKEMRQQLLDLKVNAEDILHFYDLHDFFQGRAVSFSMKLSKEAKDILNDKEKKKRTVLLLSTDMFRVGGPAKVLFSAAKILKKNGYSVLLASMIDGELREEIEESGIPVIVDENLQVFTMDEILWIRDFRLIICNTISFFIFLTKRDLGIPVMWWLHDSAFFYGGVRENVLNQISQKNLRIVSVGELPRRAMNELAPQLAIGEFLYGVQERVSPRQKVRNPRVCFAVMGYVEERKGQDILVKAVRMLPFAIREQLRVYLIGKNVSAMAISLKREIADIPEISMTGVLCDEEFADVFCKMDVLVCPSREDPMPAVVVEAMMNQIPCIVSDMVGTAAYIREGVEGCIFRSGDAGELAVKMRWCVEHRDQIETMGRAARILYKRFFSMDIFERNLIGLVESL